AGSRATVETPAAVRSAPAGVASHAASMRVSAIATGGWARTSVSNRSRLRHRSSVSRTARAEAERDAPVSRASSPTLSPRPTSRRTRSRPRSVRSTRRRPLSTTYSASPGSPWRNRTWPPSRLLGSSSPITDAKASGSSAPKSAVLLRTCCAYASCPSGSDTLCPGGLQVVSETLHVQQVAIADVVRRGVLAEGAAPQGERRLETARHTHHSLRAWRVDEDATGGHFATEALGQGLV